MNFKQILAIEKSQKALVFRTLNFSFFGYRVELPIAIQHVPIIEHFIIFF